MRYDSDLDPLCLDPAWNDPPEVIRCPDCNGSGCWTCDGAGTIRIDEDEPQPQPEEKP